MSATSRGYHYLNEYQQCPRRWYIHHILGLEETTTKTPLLLGLAWHELLSAYFRNPDTDPLPTALPSILANLRPRFVSQDEFDITAQKLTIAFPRWLESYRSIIPHQYGEPVAIATEVDFSVPLDDRFLYTGRIDAVLTFSDGRSFILEHKTTGWSATNMLQSVELSDQVTGYLLGIPADGVLLDVTAFSKTMPPAISWANIQRSKDELVDFKLSLFGLFSELTAKEEALAAGENPFTLFPRNGAWCGAFGCPYASICRTRLEYLDLTSLEGFTIRGTDGPEQTLSE